MDRRVVVLPQPLGPEQGEELAGFDLEGDVVDRGDGCAPVCFEFLFEAGNAQHLNSSVIGIALLTDS